jgi:hypothetical protein
MQITLNDLNEKPCSNYDYLYDIYGMEESFDPIKEIERKVGKSYKDLGWLIGNCQLCQTQEMLNLYLEWNNGDYKDLRWLIRNYQFCQTQEMLNIYLEWNNGDYEDLFWLIRNCQFCQTQEMLNIYLEWNNGDYKNLRWLISCCELCQTQEMVNLYLEWNNGDYKDFSLLIRDVVWQITGINKKNLLKWQRCPLDLTRSNVASTSPATAKDGKRAGKNKIN